MHGRYNDADTRQKKKPETQGKRTVSEKKLRIICWKMAYPKKYSDALCTMPEVNAKRLGFLKIRFRFVLENCHSRNMNTLSECFGLHAPAQHLLPTTFNRIQTPYLVSRH